mgnify:CR=1 FL=1
MRIGYTPEQEELRRELRAYFTKLMTPERAEALAASDGEMGRGNVYRETVAQMGKDGWLGIGWPKGWNSTLTNLCSPSPLPVCWPPHPMSALATGNER